MNKGVSTNNTIQKSLLQDNARMIFGVKTSELDTKNISLRLDKLGEAIILFKADTFTALEYSSIAVAISKLPLNYQVLLIWVNNIDSQLHELRLLQPNKSLQTNLLNRHPDWQGEIKQIGLRFAPQDHLGLPVFLEESIEIQTLNLKQPSFIKDYFLLFNYWVQYEPWKYSSINHMKFNKNIPYYAHPAIFALIWIFTCLLILFLSGIKRNSLLALLLIAWLFVDAMQLNNMSNIKRWTDDVYHDSNKLLADEELKQIAIQVKTLLGLDSTLVNKKKTKVLILSLDRYHRSRLVYHMLPLNSSYLDTSMNKTKADGLKPGDFIVSLSIHDTLVRPSSGELSFNNIKIKVKEIVYSDKYSIMEVSLK